MKLQYLSEKEIVNINGGTEEDYSNGHSIGTHIRDTISTIGSFVGWFIPFIGD